MFMPFIHRTDSPDSIVNHQIRKSDQYSTKRILLERKTKLRIIALHRFNYRILNCRKFQRARKYIGNYNLTDTSRKTQTQEFIEMYTNLKAEGALDDERIFEVALEQFEQKKQSPHDREESVSLVDDFKRAAQSPPSPLPTTTKAPGPNISVTDFYKD